MKKTLEKDKTVEYNERTSNKTQILSNHLKCLLRLFMDASEFQDVIVKDFQTW